MKNEKHGILKGLLQDEQDLFFQDFIKKYDKTDVPSENFLLLGQILTWLKAHDELLISEVENALEILKKEKELYTEYDPKELGEEVVPLLAIERLITRWKNS